MSRSLTVSESLCDPAPLATLVLGDALTAQDVPDWVQQHGEYGLTDAQFLSLQFVSGNKQVADDLVAAARSEVAEAVSDLATATQGLVGGEYAEDRCPILLRLKTLEAATVWYPELKARRQRISTALDFDWSRIANRRPEERELVATLLCQSTRSRRQQAESRRALLEGEQDDATTWTRVIAGLEVDHNDILSLNCELVQGLSELSEEATRRRSAERKARRSRIRREQPPENSKDNSAATIRVMVVILLFCLRLGFYLKDDVSPPPRTHSGTRELSSVGRKRQRSIPRGADPHDGLELLRELAVGRPTSPRSDEWAKSQCDGLERIEFLGDDACYRAIFLDCRRFMLAVDTNRSDLQVRFVLAPDCELKASQRCEAAAHYLRLSREETQKISMLTMDGVYMIRSDQFLQRAWEMLEWKPDLKDDQSDPHLQFVSYCINAASEASGSEKKRYVKFGIETAMDLQHREQWSPRADEIQQLINELHQL